MYLDLDPVFTTKLDLFDSIEKPQVAGSTSLFDLLEVIRYNINVKTFLTDKYMNGIENPVYAEIKKTSPTTCYNANFNRYKALKHLISPTNLMFLDVDGFKNKQEAEAYKSEITLKYSWIIACNLSLSRLGVHIIIYVDKIRNNADYNLKYKYISTNYFENKLDKKALSLIRHAVIAYDNNIFVNYNPSILYTEKFIKNIINNKNIGKKEGEVISTPYTFSDIKTDKHETKSANAFKLRFSIPHDESLYSDPNIPINYRNGIKVVELNLHRFKNKRAVEGQRTSILGAITMQLIYLNAYTTSTTDQKIKEAILSYMLAINENIFYPPLSKKEVVNSVDANWRKYIDGNMDYSTCFTIKRSHWSTRSTLSANEKRSITGSINTEPTKADSRKKINDAIKCLNGRGEKITQKNTASVGGMHVQAVKNYWKEFKLMVKKLNAKKKEHSSNISSKTIMKVSHSIPHLKYNCVA